MVLGIKPTVWHKGTQKVCIWSLGSEKVEFFRNAKMHHHRMVENGIKLSLTAYNSLQLISHT